MSTRRVLRHPRYNASILCFQSQATIPFLCAARHSARVQQAGASQQAARAACAAARAGLGKRDCSHLRTCAWKRFLQVETAAVCVRGESVESRVAADPENDMVRETAFFDCAVRGAKRALKLLAKSGIKAYRPPDYYVEMVKSDAHMTRVKNQLLMRKRAMRVVAERRKMQKDKKYAKQVYAARQQEKAAKKRANLAAIDAWKEGGARDEASLQKAIGGHLSTVSKQAGASANSKRIRKKNKFRDRRSRDKRNNMKKDAKIDAKLANKRKARKDGGF
ncbi:MAG: hypothetical protein MHM6MM_003979 [Cercozoa sp. M6MM]